MEALSLLILLGAYYLLLCIVLVLVILVSKLDVIVVLLKKLDKPSKAEIIGKLTLVEGQKEMIRVQMILDDQYERIAKFVANDMAKVLGGK